MTFPVDMKCEHCKEKAKYAFQTVESRNEFYKLWNKRHENCKEKDASESTNSN